VATVNKKKVYLLRQLPNILDHKHTEMQDTYLGFCLGNPCV